MKIIKQYAGINILAVRFIPVLNGYEVRKHIYKDARIGDEKISSAVSTRNIPDRENVKPVSREFTIETSPDRDCRKNDNVHTPWGKGAI